jgi:hypothetical protein
MGFLNIMIPKQKRKDAIVYEKRTDLIERRNHAGITNRELARAIGEPPSTTGGRLCGFLPLSNEQIKIILKTCQEAEIQKESVEVFNESA